MLVTYLKALISIVDPGLLPCPPNTSYANDSKNQQNIFSLAFPILHMQTIQTIPIFVGYIKQCNEPKHLAKKIVWKKMTVF